MKIKKCEKCGKLIISEPCYINKKRVCQKCFNKLKYSKRRPIMKIYFEWLKIK